ncbi:uncharacterized protein YbjT (DUF2867 family) [Nakamurella sp. UYEF19]|uniref:NmrA family NAD(P)-binding protein n=1 Tax=Nakamurella sp. UYEF19 TaxID=1756392 RepID=UPI003393EABB
MKPTVVVTGATGSTGLQVVRQLLARDWPVRALVRQVDGRAERLHSLGAQVVVADLFDPSQVVTAVRGAQRAYFCPPTHPHMLDSAGVFAVAVQEAKLDTVVVLSQWLASAAHPSILTRHHYLADQLFAAVPGIAHVTVNPGFFAHNYLQTIAFAAQLGVLPNPMGDSRNAPPSNADIAAVAVGALTDPARHDGRTYRPTGPDLLDAAEMATILGAVLSRTVRAVPMPEFLFAKAMRNFGFDAFMTAQTRTYIAEHRRGTFAYGGPTDDVHQVTGSPPETFEATARSYAQLPGAQRNAAQFARVLATLARTGMTPGGNPRRLERQQGSPSPAATGLAIDDPRWLATHTAAIRAT